MNKVQSRVGLIQKPKSKKNMLLDMLTKGPLFSIIFVVVGGLILIALLRVALRKWCKAYMPKNDGSTMTVFGIQIPGWGQMKAIGIGIYNFVRYGLVNWYYRLKGFFGKIYRSLFGRKGAFKDMKHTKSAFIRIGAALIVAQTKKLGGWVMTALGFLISLIPFCAPIGQFIMKFGPELYVFIMNQIMSFWQKSALNKELDIEAIRAAFSSAPAQVMASFRHEMLAASSKVKPFVVPETIPGLVTAPSSTRKGGPKKAAIMRVVPRRHEGVQSKIKLSQEKSAQDQHEEMKGEQAKFFSAQAGNANSAIGKLVAKADWAVRLRKEHGRVAYRNELRYGEGGVQDQIMKEVIIPEVQKYALLIGEL